MKKLGLIGFPLSHSFSKKYYLEKFAQEGITHIDYDLYNIEHIPSFSDIYTNTDFYGVNVTIPHKISVLPYLQELSPEAKEIGAVNCIQIKHRPEGPYLIGYNTDVYGFQESLRPLLKAHHTQALILGNGGAAKAVVYALTQLGISYTFVSRTKAEHNFSYEELTAELIQAHPLLINCSPVGTYPNIEQYPNIPYEGITADHLLYDLIYNPEETAFLRLGREHGAQTKNGLEMLILQAEKNWEIWNS